MKVKSDHTKRFPAHDFLQVGLSFQTSRINNKGDISTFHDKKTPAAAILFLKMRPKIFPDNILWLLIYTANLRKLAIIFFHQSSNGEISLYTLRLSSGYNDLLNSENLKVAIAQLCHDIEVCNFTML